MNKEIVLRKLLKDVETTNDLGWIINNLERIYLDKRVQEQILKVINNSVYYKNNSKEEIESL